MASEGLAVGECIGSSPIDPPGPFLRYGEEGWISSQSPPPELSARSRHRSRPCPLKQLHDGLLNASGSSSGSLKNLAKQANFDNSRAADKLFLITSALQPAGSIWRRRMKQGGGCSDFTSSVSEEQSTYGGDWTDLDSLSQLEKSVASELEPPELSQDLPREGQVPTPGPALEQAEASSSAGTWVEQLQGFMPWSSDGDRRS